MDWYKRYMGDYMRDTGRLSLAEHGAYTLLLDEYYASETSLPVELAALERICRATTKLERDAVRLVAERFFPANAGVRRNQRADDEIAAFAAKSQQASGAGQDGAASRWGSSSSKERGKETRARRLSEARQLGTHTKLEWLTMVEVCGAKCVRCGQPAENLMGRRLCKDHVIPIYQGGSDSIDNLQPMCRNCNASKGQDAQDLRPPDWKERLTERLANVRHSATHSVTHLNGEMPGEMTGNASGYPETRNQKPETRNQKPDAERARTHEEFQQLKAAYPPGIYRESEWLVAEREVLDHLENGHAMGELLAGVKRYAAQCRAKSSTGTQFVLSPVKFFDRRAPKFAEPFPLPLTRPEQRQESNVEAALTWLAGSET